MYNFHGHPWAKILNPKIGSKKPLKSQIQNIIDKILEDESKEEKYFNDFFQWISKDEQFKESKNQNGFETSWV